MPVRSHTRSRWLLGAALAGVVAGVVPATPASAAGSIVCHYTLIQWHGGFFADLKITNNGPTINGWTARWTFAEPTVVTSVWTAQLTQTASVATATNMSWNPTIATGTALTFGWTATARSTSVPTDITVNGQSC